ncbi:MAG: LapA family protein [Gallionella sp.]|nr:LapA family protein [Gallionella sp.]
MRYISWLSQMFIFIILLGFALKNGQAVTLHYFFGYEWQSTLVIVSLLFFAIGAGLGILATLSIWFRQRREISSLKREISDIRKLAGKNEVADAPV